MKKLSPERKKFLDTHSKKIHRRNTQVKSGSVKGKHQYGPLHAPMIVDVDDINNYDSTINFFHDLRKLADNKKRKIRIKFDKMKKLTPSAALILVAELDRAKKVRDCKLYVNRNFIKLDHDIRVIFMDMGIIDLLKIDNVPKILDDKKKPIFFPFRSSTLTDGSLAVELSEKIEKECVIDIPHRVAIRTALTEAMENMEHAYLASLNIDNLLKEPYWWMFASYDADNRCLTISFYDQGVGIAKTIGIKIRDHLHIENWTLLGDAKRIQTATELGRNRNNEDYRGTGFGSMKNYIDLVNRGRLRIINGKGEYHYYGKEKESTPFNHKKRLQGTLIEWRIEL